MEMFDHVAIVCDTSSKDVGEAVRAALELFRVHVYFHWCVQKRNVADALEGRIPETDYTVLCAHGLGSSDAPAARPQQMGMGFHVVDNQDGRWEEIEFALTPGNIADAVRLPGRRVLALGCGNGREPLARAFLDAGCASYMGPIDSVDQDSTAMFAISFFYHLLMHERDDSLSLGEREAFERARAFDTASAEGTHLFRRYCAD